MDSVFHQLLLHIVEIHPPDAFAVLGQGAVDDAVAAVIQLFGEADVGGGVDENLVALGANRAQGAEHPAQDAVFIADALLRQAGNAIAVRLPVDNGVKVLRRGLEVAVGGVLGAGDNGLRDRGYGREVHVRHPHGDEVEAILGLGGGEAGHGAQGVARASRPRRSMIEVKSYFMEKAVLSLVFPIITGQAVGCKREIGQGWRLC